MVSDSAVESATAESAALVPAPIDLSLVIPFFNPGPRLAPHVRDILGTLLAEQISFEVIAVSDGSTDGSPSSISGIDQVRIVELAENQGKGAALRVGLAQGKGRYLGFIDADGDIPARVLSHFLVAIRTGEPDVVLGSKRHPDSEVIYPPLRRLYSWGYQQLTRLLFRLPTRDTQTGVKLIRRETLAAVLPKMLEKRFAFDLELLVVARQMGYRNFIELPIQITERFTTTISLKAVCRTLRDTLAIFYRLRVTHFYGTRSAPVSAFGSASHRVASFPLQIPRQAYPPVEPQRDTAGTAEPSRNPGPGRRIASIPRPVVPRPTLSPESTLRCVDVRAKAPLRISFAGGGTDVAPFPESEGGAVLSATIDHFAYGSLSPRADNQISIESVDFGMSLDFPVTEDPVLDGKLDLVKAAIRRLRQEAPGGYDLVLRSSAPPGSGLGSSSTMMVALVGLLHRFYGLPLDQYEIADLAYAIERHDLAIRGGYQDHYAATFGGFNFIEFGERVVVNPLRIRDSTVNELELNLLLCFTGVTRESAHIIADQTHRVESAQADTLAGLRAQKELAVSMKSALLRGKLNEFAELLGEAWREKQRLSPLITTPRIQEVYDLAVRNGAVSGKVTGAGGGGYILFYCDFKKKHRVAEALERIGVSAIGFSFEPRGLTTWRA